MTTRKRVSIAFGFLVLVGCGAGLPRALRDEIRSEKDKLQAADARLRRSEDTVRNDLAQAPSLFQGVKVSDGWQSRLRSDRQELEDAKRLDRDLEEISHRDRADARARAESLLSQIDKLRDAAVRDAEGVETAANRWIQFDHNVPSLLSDLQTQYAAVRSVDLAPVTKVVDKAEQDWPAKKTDLDNRLAALRAMPDQAEVTWRDTAQDRQDAAAGKATPAEIATLIQADDTLSEEASDLSNKASELRDMSSQLYDAWDKVLTDLDTTQQHGEKVYREKLRTVETHFADANAKSGEITSSQAWVDVSEPAYHAVENDLGMTIAHKDKGLYDSEAQTTPQPPGFAYMAPPSQGSNQYGYWTERDGARVWEWLPAYFIMRDLLWGHDYRPVIIDDYYGYRTAQSRGHTYYGEATPEAPPRYGTHGTFTQRTYANSRYIQSGGFRGSGYASRYQSSSPSEARDRVYSNRDRAFPGESSEGRRFGTGSSGFSSGKRFGSGSRSFPSGKRFGGSFGSSGRSFGRRR